MAGWIPDNVVAAMAGSYELGIFLRIETDPVFRVWFAAGDVQAGIDSVDEEGAVYFGGGALIGIPTLEILVNGTADSVDFTLSGVDAATGAEMVASIPAVRGVKVHIGITTLDQYYQPMSSIIPIWWGTASHISESSEAAQGEESPTLTISLTVATGEATRSRPARALWSDEMQKSISPDDDFCKQMARLARGIAPIWPNY